MKIQKHSSKYVENSVITWRIRNFSFSQQSSYSLMSSSFTLDSSVSCRWYLALEWLPSDNAGDEQTPRLHLIRRTRSDSIKNDIRVSFRFAFTLGDKKTYSTQAYNGVLGKGSVCSVPTPIDITSVTFLVDVICEIMIYKDLDESSLDSQYALEVPIYEKKNPHDKNVETIIFEGRDGEVVANKNIALFHCRALCRIMTQQSSDEKCKLENFSTRTIHQLLFYLYNNRLDFYTGNYLDFDLLELAMKLCVPDLMNLMMPRKILLNSENLSGTKEVVWKVSNFSLMKSKKYLQSPTITIGSTDEVTFCLKLFQNTDKIGLYLQMLSGSPDVDINIQMYALDNNLHNVFKLSYSVPYCANKVVGSVNWILKDPMGIFRSHLLCEDILTIICRAADTNLQYRSKVDEIYELQASDADAEGSITESMFCLQLQEKNSDLNMKIGGKTFPVHRPVLRFRSNTFDDLLQKPVVSFEDLAISENLMEVILQYIYRGKLHLPDFGTAFKIYEASFEVEVDLLQELCVNYLIQDLMSYISQSNDGNYNINSVKARVVHYVGLQCPEILALNEWVDINMDSPETIFAEESFRSLVQLQKSKRQEMIKDSDV